MTRRRPASDAEERANATAAQNRKIQRRGALATRLLLLAEHSRKRINLPAYGTRRPRGITPRTYSHTAREQRRAPFATSVARILMPVTNADPSGFVLFLFSFFMQLMLHCRKSTRMILEVTAIFCSIKSASTEMHVHGGTCSVLSR